jgi:hypothetical protein
MENELLAFLNVVAQKYGEFFEFYSKGNYQDPLEALAEFVAKDDELAELVEASDGFASAVQEELERNSRNLEEIMQTFFGEGFFGSGLSSNTGSNYETTPGTNLGNLRARLEELMKRSSGEPGDPTSQDGEGPQE